MLSLGARIQRIEPDQLWSWSRVALFIAFGFSCAAILLSVWISVTILTVLSALFLGALVFSILARDEIALLCAVIVGFVAVVRYAEGFQIEEVLYGAAYLGYLAYWFISRLFFYRDQIFRTKADWALFLFLVYTTLSLGLTPVLEGDMRAAISEWLSISMLAFYFPIKEVCIRRSDCVAQKRILLSFGAVALFVAIRNLLDYRAGLSQAEYLWQIAGGRVVMNEHVLLVAGLVTLLFLVHSRKWPQRAFLGVLFFFFASGVIIGQSRVVWVSFLLGAATIFLFVDARKRLYLALLGVGSLASAVLVGMVLFDNFISIIIAGLANRFLSLGTAASQDLSLINRFVETGVAWEYIKKNPIIGYGFGVPIKYYSLVLEYTRVESYVHNGYVGVWYRHGLIGAALVLTFYFGAMWSAFRTLRHRTVQHFDRLIAIAAMACLAAESLAGTMANHFATSDTTLIIGAIAGLAAASWHRTEMRGGDAVTE